MEGCHPKEVQADQTENPGHYQDVLRWRLRLIIIISKILKNFTSTHCITTVTISFILRLVTKCRSEISFDIKQKQFLSLF